MIFFMLIYFFIKKTLQLIYKVTFRRKKEIYQKSEMVMKVKEPLPVEYPFIRKGQVLFTYFHFASYEPLTKAMLDSEAVCLAYETVEKPISRPRYKLLIGL